MVAPFGSPSVRGGTLVKYLTPIDQAFHLKTETSEKIWRIRVFRSGEIEAINITYGQVGKRLRTISPCLQTEFATRLSEALARIREKERKGYIRIPLGAFEALSRRRHTTTDAGSPVYSTTSKPMGQAKKRTRRLDVGVLLNADPSKWFF